MKKSNRQWVSDACNAIDGNGRKVYPNVTAFFEAACRWEFGDSVTATQMNQARNAAKQHLSGGEPRFEYITAFAKTQATPPLRAENRPRRIRPAFAGM